MKSPPDTCDLPWESPPADLALKAGDVHIWRSRLEAPQARIEGARAMLAPDEVARADRFLREVHGMRFTLARAALRVLLGRYLDVRPEEVRFRYSDQGKPFLEDWEAQRGIQFNLSHSGSVALLGFTFERAIGIDVEAFRENLEADKIARRYFAPGEVETLFALPEELRKQGFYNCWTRKEAYIKACGDGLRLPLNSFDVSLVPGEAPELLRAQGGDAEIERWSFHQLEPGPGYAATLVVEARQVRLRTFEFDIGDSGGA